MKVSKVSLFLAFLVAVCLPAVTQTQMRLDIPFNLIVAGKSVPAGHYMVVPAFGSDNSSWHIYGDHDSATVMTRPEPSPRTEHRPTMVFQLTNQGYALVQFRPTGYLGRD